MDRVKEKDEVTFEIRRHLGALSEPNDRGWSCELNLVAWNGREAKLDIRDWSDDHTRMSKGVTLTGPEGVALHALLGAYLKG